MFKFSENFNYLMPAHFGGYEGQPKPATYHDVTMIKIAYKTDPEMLAQYIPEAFELTQSVVSIEYAMNRGVEWMGGGGYNLINVTVPVAHVQGQERIEGGYVLVIWENCTDPILTGREQTGMPKIFADIQDHRQIGDKLFTNASYGGSAFLKIEFQKMKQMTAEELSALNRQRGKMNPFGWRYIPNIGRPGAALSHATLFPMEFVFTTVWAGKGSVHWEAPTPEQHPIQAPIINALSQLPIRSYQECMMTQGSQVLRNDIARQLS